MQLISCFLFASLVLSSLAQSSGAEPASVAIAPTANSAPMPSPTPDQGEQDDKGSQRSNAYLLARGAARPAAIPIEERPIAHWLARGIPNPIKVNGGKLPRTRPQRLAADKFSYLKQSAPVHPFERRDNLTANEKVSTVEKGFALEPSTEGQTVTESVCKPEMQHCCGEVVTPEAAKAKGVRINPAMPVKAMVALNCVPLSLLSESGCRGVSICCAEALGFYAFGRSVLE